MSICLTLIHTNKKVFFCAKGSWFDMKDSPWCMKSLQRCQRTGSVYICDLRHQPSPHEPLRDACVCVYVYMCVCGILKVWKGVPVFFPLSHLSDVVCPNSSPFLSLCIGPARPPPMKPTTWSSLWAFLWGKLYCSAVALL